MKANEEKKVVVEVVDKESFKDKVIRNKKKILKVAGVIGSCGAIALITKKLTSGSKDLDECESNVDEYDPGYQEIFDDPESQNEAGS